MNTCPTCSGPMKVLFTGFYCPKDCDRKPVTVSSQQSSNIRYFIHGMRKWKMQRAPKGDRVPDWATFGWWDDMSDATQGILDNPLKAWTLRDADGSYNVTFTGTAIDVSGINTHTCDYDLLAIARAD